ALGEAAQLLDVAEDVVPAPAVEPGGVIAQLPQNLVGLERREDRLDQHGRADGAARNAERVLREVEDVVPEPRLQVTLDLWQVVIGTAAFADQRRRIVIERQPEIEQRCRDGGAVQVYVFFDQMPPPGPNEQRRRLGGQRVALPLGTRVGDRPGDGILQIALADDVVLPRWGVGILEVGHEDVGARVEAVDDHLAVHRARDLHAPIAQIGRDGRDGPRVVANRFRLGEEVRKLARVELRLAQAPALEQLTAPRLEAVRQRGEKVEGARAEDVVASRRRGLTQLDGRVD